MAKYKVLYTDTGMADVMVERDVLAKADAELVMASSIDEETLIAEGIDCDGVMIEYAEINARILDAWGERGKVKVIGRQGIGVNNIDVEAATRNNIMVANVPDYCLEEVADHTMTLALNVLREIKSFGKRMEKGDFEEHSMRPIFRLRDRNFCVYGFGNIAKRVIKRAQAFGFHTFTYDPFVSDEELNEYNTTKVESLYELAGLADVFSIHVPLVESTKHSVNNDIFKCMKASCVVINTARGQIIDGNDLLEALRDNVIAGAGLDVFEQEPLDSSNPLLQMDNVSVTPHISWYSEEANTELRTRLAENMTLTFMTGKPRSFVNRETLIKYRQLISKNIR